jgi:uncharacterized membrane protein (DUF373 family)
VRSLVGRTPSRRGSRNWGDMRRDWAILTLYQRFEGLMALLLRIVIGAVILVALYRLLVSVTDTLVLRSLNPLDHTVFQEVFGQILTLLIALEFNHTLQYVVSRERGIIQARIVILIAILALARKVIVLDLSSFPASTMVALATLTLALGVTYRLVRDRDDARRRRGRRAGSASLRGALRRAPRGARLAIDSVSRGVS